MGEYVMHKFKLTRYLHIYIISIIGFCYNLYRIRKDFSNKVNNKKAVMFYFPF